MLSAPAGIIPSMIGVSLGVAFAPATNAREPVPACDVRLPSSTAAPSAPSAECPAKLG
jgi:hypothetical protein